jgi:ferredoxin
MKVFVDMSACDSHGECCYLAPEVFRLDDDDELHYDENPPSSERAAVADAVRACPVAAISVFDDDRG